MSSSLILIVEDEQVVALYLTTMLQKLGYRVLDTDRGDEALALASQHQPSLILMDIRLAEATDGIESARAIRAHLDIPIVFLTAHMDDTTRQRAAQVVPYGYLVKPCDQQTLQSTIEMTLVRHGLDRQIRAREQWFATTLTSIDDSVVMTDSAAMVTFVNPSAARLLHMTPEDSIGRPVDTVVRLIDSMTGIPVIHPVHEALTTQAGAQSASEALLISQDGTKTWVDNSAAPIVIPPHTTIGAVMVFRDATARRQADRRRIATVQSQEERKHIDRLRILAGGAAHDLNNLMAGIRGYVELAYLDIGDAASVADALMQIDTITRRAANLAQHLQAYAGRARLVVEQIDLNSLLYETINALRMTHLHQIAITVDTAAGLSPIKGDTIQIQQVILSLLVNAAEAVAPIGGAINIRTAERNVEAIDWATCNGPAIRPGRYAVLEIRDTGVGMDDTTRKQIFDPFFSTKQPGRGLGLAAVLSSVRGHHGTVLVESASGQGTTMIVLIPTI